MAPRITNEIAVLVVAGRIATCLPFLLDVLHYDSDYDLIGERTDLTFESVWVAPRGSLS